MWKPALEAAEVPAGRENGMHGLRHHYASVLLEGGVNIRALAVDRAFDGGPDVAQGVR